MQVAQQDLLIAQREVVDDLVPIMVWVASKVLASWSAYSLNVTAASSWASRSRAFFGGTKYSVPSKMCLLTAVGQ